VECALAGCGEGSGRRRASRRRGLVPLLKPPARPPALRPPSRGKQGEPIQLPKRLTRAVVTPSKKLWPPLPTSPCKAQTRHRLRSSHDLHLGRRQYLAGPLRWQAARPNLGTLAMYVALVQGPREPESARSRCRGQDSFGNLGADRRHPCRHLRRAERIENTAQQNLTKRGTR
jgi:hypothetical protein